MIVCLIIDYVCEMEFIRWVQFTLQLNISVNIFAAIIGV